MDEIDNIDSYKEIYISKSFEYSWRIAANKCKEHGLNILNLESNIEKLKLLSIHKSYKYGSEWVALTHLENYCAHNNYNKQSLFYDLCSHDFNLRSSKNIVCQEGKKYLCEKLVDSKDLINKTGSFLNTESTTKNTGMKVINCNHTIYNDIVVDTTCDIELKGELNVYYDVARVDNFVASNPISNPLKLLIIVVPISIIIIIALKCCSRKCCLQKIHNNIDNTVIINASQSSLLNI